MIVNMAVSSITEIPVSEFLQEINSTHLWELSSPQLMPYSVQKSYCASSKQHSMYSIDMKIIIMNAYTDVHNIM